jgi:hypothetical protein
MKKLSIELILSIMLAPFIIWFCTFVASTYRIEASMENTKSDITEIKSDIKYIKNYLLENKK